MEDKQPTESSRTLIIGDSLGMPRDEVAYAETWVHKLKQEVNREIVSRCKRARTTDSLQNPDALERYDPETVITQIGIVDCSPRYSNRIDRALFEVLPSKFTEPYARLLKRVRTRRPKRAYVDRSRFRNNLEDYYRRADERGTTVISIKIAPASTSLQSVNPHISHQISAYNAIYDDLADEYGNVIILDPYESVADPDSIMVEYEHINPRGHDLVLHSVLSVLEKQRTMTELD